MRKIGSKKRFALIATTVAAVLVGSGVAVAYWTTTGSGTGTAATGTTSTVTVNQTGAAITGLYPGGPAVQVPFNIVNGNVSGQYITTVALSVTVSHVSCSGSFCCWLRTMKFAGPTTRLFPDAVNFSRATSAYERSLATKLRR